MYERLKILVNYRNWKVVSVCRKFCAEEVRHAASKFRRAITMKISVENSKIYNIAAKYKILKTAS